MRACHTGDHRLNSEDQKAAEGLDKCVLSVIQEKGFVESQCFNTDETDLFPKDVGKQTCVTEMAFEVMKIS